MSKLKKYQTREDGFTLVELLIVVLIIGVLAAIAIPVYLGVQNQSHKAAVRADTNVAVKKVQVALTEGATVASQYGVSNGSEKGETVQVKASTSSAAGPNDFMVIGNESKSNNPAGAIDYTYQYDSVTGKFSDSDSGDIPLGGASQAKVVITTASLADATTTDAYSQNISVVNTNTSGANVFAITGLPTGLTYSSSTGVISGQATATGSSNVNVTVTNGSVSDSRNYTLQVNKKPTVSPTTLPNPATGTAYSQTLTATGTPNTGFTYAVTSGTLPTGLNLDSSTGIISGTPTATGPFTFAIAASNSAGQGNAQSYTVTVGTAPTISASASNASVIWPALSKIGYLPSESPTATGYPSPTFSATNLPTGLSMNTSTGVISGTPTTAGNYTNITISAANAYGTATRTVSMNVNTGNNAYTYYMDQSGQASAIGGGVVRVGGWVVESDSSHSGQYVSVGDNSKSNLRIDIQVNSSTVYSGLTDVSRSDVNNAFGGNIGNMHGFAVNLSVGTGTKQITVIARDGDNYQIISNFSVNVN